MVIDSQTSLSFDGRVYLFGGFIGGSKPHYSNKTFLFEPQTVQYRQIETSGLPPLARSDHSSTLIDDEMVVFGGISDNNTYLNDVWMLNLSQHSWRRIGVSGEKPSARIGHSCASYSSVLIIFGGHEEASKEATRIYALDVAKPAWRKFADSSCESEPEPWMAEEGPKKGLAGSGLGGGSPKKPSSPGRAWSPIKEVASSSKSGKSRDVLGSRDEEGRKEGKTITAKELKLERIKKKKELEKRRLLDEFDVSNVTEREIVDKEITKMQNILEAINSEKDTSQLVKGRMRVMKPGISRFSEKIGSRLEPIALPHLDGLSMCRDTSRLFIFGGDKWGLCSNDLFVVDVDDLLGAKSG